MRRSHRIVAVAAMMLVAMCVEPVVARAQTVVSAGVNLRLLSGTFGGTQTTHVVYAPAVLRVDVNRIELSASFPLLVIDAGSVAMSQAGFVPMQGSLSGAPAAGMSMHGGMMGQSTTSPSTPAFATATTLRQSGFGDVVTSAGYRVVDSVWSNLQVVVGARLKLPTANADVGLGTGKTDVAGVVTVRKRYDTGWVSAEAGYLVIGKPTGADLSNVALWSAGGGRRLSDRWYLLGSANGSSAVVQAFGSPAEIGAGIGVRLGERMALTVLPSVGLSHASPKYALTVGVSSDLLRR